MKGGAMALVGTSGVPAFLQRSVLAQTTTAQGKKLVVIFQRGAADGLNIVVPHAESNYYQLRPTIAIPQDQLIDLDGFFGLHPAMQSFKPLFDQGHLAMVQAVGSPDTTRSHFDAQDYMESGTPGVKATPDGWLNRALQAEDLHRQQSHTAFRAVALGSQVPRTLGGKVSAIAVNRVQDFDVAGKSANATPISSAFEAMYATSVDTVLHGTGQETFAAVKMLKATDPRITGRGQARTIPMALSATNEADRPVAARRIWVWKPPSLTSGAGIRIRIRAASKANWPTACATSARDFRFSWTDVGSDARKCSTRRQCPNSAARRSRTAPVEPITGTPT